MSHGRFVAPHWRPTPIKKPIRHSIFRQNGGSVSLSNVTNPDFIQQWPL